MYNEGLYIVKAIFLTLYKAYIFDEALFNLS